MNELFYYKHSVEGILEVLRKVMGIAVEYIVLQT